MKASDFFRGLFTVDMRADEIIANVQFTPVRTAAYAKLHQRASHYAIVGVAAALEVSGGVITSARIGLTGATSHAMSSAQRRAGPGGTDRCRRRRSTSAARLAGQDLEEMNADLHASAEYRRAMVQVFAGRALSAAMARS